jgi:hypothetical protein
MSMNGTYRANGQASTRTADRARWTRPGGTRSRGIWPGAIFALLGMNVCIVGITVFAATRGSAAAVEPNYYERAVHWDQDARALERSRLQGWSVDVRLTPATQGAGSDLVVHARDRDGKPLDAATITASLFHHARPGEIAEPILSPDPDGGLRASVPGAAPGLWRVNLSIIRGSDRWSRTIDLDFKPGRGGNACSR